MMDKFDAILFGRKTDELMESFWPVAKGAIQFPIYQPLPEKLIADIVKFRVNENNNKKRK